MSSLRGHLHNIHSVLSSRGINISSQKPGEKEGLAKADSASANATAAPNAVDLTIQFISASGLPKMDVGGLCDPYFVANIDGKVEYVYVLYLAASHGSSQLRHFR
jgi:hypothetical protein